MLFGVIKCFEKDSMPRVTNKLTTVCTQLGVEVPGGGGGGYEV